ncbi:hypothetical protein L195_g029469 [Trifolium pratense]|uniref:Uncharacterized protein n=1 Tax=Trifolium pratense TaxID=57577 RepID=A0A2K3L4V4_TRIPR|nr:hypothetical protein L195_g029469 [Trifolium pratense]
MEFIMTFSSITKYLRSTTWRQVDEESVDRMNIALEMVSIEQELQSDIGVQWICPHVDKVRIFFKLDHYKNEVSDLKDLIWQFDDKLKHVENELVNQDTIIWVGI